MEYKSTSIKSVIGNVIRNTRISSTDYIDSMKEWIPEAMAMMHTQTVMNRRHVDLDVRFYKAKLPCGLVKVSAVTSGGSRLRHYSGERTYSSQKNTTSTTRESYISTPKTVTTVEYKGIYTWTFAAGSLTLASLFYGTASSALISLAVVQNGTLAPLVSKLNQIQIGTFTAAWNAGGQLIITCAATDTEMLEFTYALASNLNNPLTILPSVTLVNPDVSQNYSSQAVDIKTVQGLPYSEATYYTELDYINTSFCDGKITLFYTELPLDEEDMPLIPDNQNYKQALYWYTRAMMIGAGYEDKVFNFQYCLNLFETVYAPRAIGEITYPSVDQAMSSLEAGTRLIFDAGAFDSYFDNAPEP